jgi:hypothetical protein
MNHELDASTGQGDDLREQTIVMSPPALLWLQEFEQANGHRDGTHLWRDLHGKALRRGTGAVGDLNWPGIVHVPSPLMERDLGKKIVQLPLRWSKISPPSTHAQIASSFTAWEIDRGIYRLTPRTKLLVANCNVNAPLLPAMFESMPSHGIYVDLFSSSIDGLESFGDSTQWDENLPLGFFASIDQPKPGQLDLVLLMDRHTHLDVHVIALNGKTLDELASNMLAKARRQTTGSRAWAETEVRETASLWHLCISALLMTCINRHRMKVFTATQEDPFAAVRQPWVVWEVGHGIDNQIDAEMSRHESSGRQAMLVGHWCQPLAKEAIRLQFAAGCQLNWDALEKRHGPSARGKKSEGGV